MNSLPNPADPGDPGHKIPDGDTVPLPPQRRRWWRVGFIAAGLVAAVLIVVGIWINR